MQRNLFLGHRNLLMTKKVQLLLNLFYRISIGKNATMKRLSNAYQKSWIL